MIRLGGNRFYSNDFKLGPQHYPDLIELVAFISVLFEVQKNRLKFNTCTQIKTNDLLLCPVIR